MGFDFVETTNFTPNSGTWTAISNIVSWTQNGNDLFLKMAAVNMSLKVSFLGPRCFRVRFSPVPGTDYTVETISYSVVNRTIAAINLPALNPAASPIVVDTGQMTVIIDLTPFRIRVYRNGQLVSCDEPSYNLVYIPGQEVIANFKTYPANSVYCGFGEKAGATVFKNQTSMTFFNYDDFAYGGPVPPGPAGGPTNAAQPLYCSVPLLIEVNPNPVGDFAGPAYAYGIFFDNPSQSYVNIGLNDANSMFGKYYFGALYGEMDYYFMLGDQMSEVVSQYTTLTGRAPMPPKYVFGFHQGAYGYFDRYTLGRAANSYRAANIPIDGLHIDVDFQDNYRTFTHSELKFPNAKEMLDDLHGIGFKCSTNVTPIMKDPVVNPLNENGQIADYPQHDALFSAGGLLFNTRAGHAPAANLYVGEVNYGTNRGSNPYPYPPLQPGPDGSTPLSAMGNYPDFGKSAVRSVWGNQYAHLINDLGMDMIWQDMMCPAIGSESMKTFPLDLNMDRGDGVYVPNAKIHNAYGINLLNATWNGVTSLRLAAGNETRSFIIARGGYAGMQRYAALWTGDSLSSWDFLRILIPEVINIGLSGIPISGADVGGFATDVNKGGPNDGTTSNSYIDPGSHTVMGGITNYELLTRWMQVGAFLPWYRNHYDGYNKQFQEAYAYGEPVPTNCRKYVSLRYRLVQLFYDMMFQWTQTGMPIVRPLFLNDPNDANLYTLQLNSAFVIDTEFFVGRDLLVAPILSQHESLPVPTPPTRDIYLPAGSQWYSFKDNTAVLEAPVAGGTTVTGYYAPLSLVPLYVRAGAIIPTRELEQYIGQLTSNPLTLNIYPGPDSSYTLYQDDGKTTDAETNAEYRTTSIQHQGVPGGQRITVTRIFDQYTPEEPFYFVALLGTSHPSSVTLDGVSLIDVGTNQPAQLTNSTVNAYYWNSGIQVTFVKVFDTKPETTLVLLF